MKSIKEVEKDIVVLRDFHDLIETYEEIAAIRMRKVKKSVLLAREFLKGLSDVFKFVEMAYDTYIVKLGKLKQGKTHFIKTNGKDVFVLLSANMGLYGEIVHETVNKFIEDSKKSQADLVIIGKRGKRIFETVMPGKKFEYFDLSDSGSDDNSMDRVLDYVLQYRNIYVYHGIFDTILKQKAVATNVTGDISTFAGKEDDIKEGNLEDPKFGFFEPTIEEVATFFETQTLAVIFEQTMHESSLSKFASRMVTLDLAVSNVNDQMKKTNFNLKKLKHRKSNKEQITLISSLFAKATLENAGK